MKRSLRRILSRFAWRVFTWTRADVYGGKDWICTGDFGGHCYVSCGWEGVCAVERCKSCGRVGSFPGEYEAECPGCGAAGEVEEACPQCGAPASINYDGAREFFGLAPSVAETPDD